MRYYLRPITIIKMYFFVYFARLSEIVLKCDESACQPKITADGEQTSGFFVSFYILYLCIYVL